MKITKKELVKLIKEQVKPVSSISDKELNDIKKQTLILINSAIARTGNADKFTKYEIQNFNMCISILFVHFFEGKKFDGNVILNINKIFS